MCEDKKGELYECTGAADETDAGTACLGGSTYQRDLVFDPARGSVVLAAEQADTENNPNAVTITLEPAGFKLSSTACGGRIEKL